MATSRGKVFRPLGVVNLTQDAHSGYGKRVRVLPGEVESFLQGSVFLDRLRRLAIGQCYTFPYLLPSERSKRVVNSRINRLFSIASQKKVWKQFSHKDRLFVVRVE